MVIRLRRIGIGKVIIVLVFIIIVIQIWHINILIKHENEFANSNDLHGEFQQLGSKLTSAIENAHVLDSSGSYYIITDVFGSQKINTVMKNDTSLVSQTSGNHLDNLIDLSDRWDGPISIAVFTHMTDFVFTIRKLLYLYNCFSKIRNQIYFHIVFPINDIPSSGQFKNGVDRKFNCGIKIKDEATTGHNYEIEGIEYPHNILRNVAIKFCSTKYTFLIDIDMIPSQKLRTKFNNLVFGKKLSENRTLAFIVPSFEFLDKDNIEIPQNKAHLLQYWRIRKTRPFYYYVCWKCQRQTDYEKWKLLPESNILNVAYFKEWIYPWEPFYIVQKEFPLYDERFKQYGFNRISQVCEMNLAGYSFAVLDNAFLIHRGYKYKDHFHKTKELENNKNRDLFRQFKREMKTKYPHSTHSC